MANIEIFEGMGGVEMVLIDRGNNEFTSMTKAHWDELEDQKELGGTL